MSRHTVSRSGALTFGLMIAILPLVAPGASAESRIAARTVIPVRQIALSSGARLYIVPIAIGSTFTHAKLESASTGLRVMPNVLGSADVDPTDRRDVYRSPEGETLTGIVAKAPVTLGTLTQMVSLQLISAVSSGAKMLSGQTSSNGDGIPEKMPLEEGTSVILGTGMADAELPSFLPAMGVRRWIVRLPRPDGHFAGRVILNPDDDEVENFVKIPLASASDRDLPGPVAGCLVNDKAKLSLCGLVQLDTGIDGIRVEMPALTTPWQEGTRATLIFSDASGHPVAAEHLLIGLEAQGSRLLFERGSAQQVRIFAGLSPYLAFSILYDPDDGTIGFSPRRTMAAGPEGEMFLGR